MSNFLQTMENPMNIALKTLQPTLKPNHLHETVVVSSGVFLPENRVKSDDLMAEIKSFDSYGIPENWLSRKAGIIERRFCDSTDSPSSLAMKAAEKAIADSGIDPMLIDKIVFCGIDKDQAEPATAHVINHKLGLQAKEAYDITDACFGFMRGIQDCSRSIKLGEAKYALVLTGETPSLLTKNLMEQMKKGVEKSIFKKWIGFLTTGDAGGAVILGRSAPEIGNGFQSITTKVLSQHHELCQYKWEDNGDATGQMLMGKLNAHGRRILAEFNEQIKSDPNYKPADYLLTHNTGSGSFEILSRLDLAPRSCMPELFSTLGNITSATFPVNFHHLDKKIGLSSGDRVGGLFSGSGLVFGHFDYLK